MPRGQFMGIPTDLRSLAASEVLSPAGLLRVPLDRVISPTPMGQDVSVGEFISARVGREVVDRLVEPLLGGVYAGRADALSMQATMPALFRELRHDRSLLAATRRVAGGGMEAAGARRGLPFRGVVGGVGRVPGAMAAALVGSGVQIRTRTTVRGLTATETGWDVEVGPASSPEVIHADGVIVATPARPRLAAPGRRRPERGPGALGDRGGECGRDRPGVPQRATSARTRPGPGCSSRPSRVGWSRP